MTMEVGRMEKNERFDVIARAVVSKNPNGGCVGSGRGAAVSNVNKRSPLPFLMVVFAGWVNREQQAAQSSISRRRTRCFGRS